MCISGVNTRFDTKKYGKIFQALSNRYDFTSTDCFTPKSLDEDDFKLVHTQRHLLSLSNS